MARSTRHGCLGGARLLSTMVHKSASVCVSAASSQQNRLAQLHHQLPSATLCRLEEYYDSVLAEDLAVLSYRHALSHPLSPHLRSLHWLSQEATAQDRLARQAYLDRLGSATSSDPPTSDQVLESSALVGGYGGSSSICNGKSSQRGRTAIPFLSGPSPSAGAPKFVPAQSDSATTTTSSTDPDALRYKRWLAVQGDPAASHLHRTVPIYEQLPRLLSITCRMTMMQAVTHHRRILLHGLLAMQLVTARRPALMLASRSDALSRIRSGTGLYHGTGTVLRCSATSQVCLKNDETLYAFLEKLVEIVLPNLRDYVGFHRFQGASFEPTGRISIRLPAEAWLLFPEMEQTYLKFPQQGSVGCLQDLEIEFDTSATNDDEARLLLSGFRIPFVDSRFPDPPRDAPSKSSSSSDMNDDVQDV